MATTDRIEADKKEIIERLNKEVYSAGNLDLIDEFYAEDYVEHNPALPDEIRGREDVRGKIGTFQSAFSEATGATEDIVAEGNEVADRHRSRLPMRANSWESSQRETKLISGGWRSTDSTMGRVSRRGSKLIGWAWWRNSE